MSITLERERLRRELLPAVDRLNCGILAKDADGVVIYANRRLLKWLDYTEEEVVGHPADRLVPSDLGDVFRKEMRLIASGDARARIGVLKRKDSTTFPTLHIPEQRPVHESERKYYVSIIIDLGTIQTAKPTSSEPPGTLRGSIDRIALELQALGLSANLLSARPLPLGHPDLAELSDREREILTYLVNGERVAGIAERLHISPHTVRNHLKSIYRRLDVSGQVELIDRVRLLSDAEESP